MHKEDDKIINIFLTVLLVLAAIFFLLLYITNGQTIKDLTQDIIPNILSSIFISLVIIFFYKILLKESSKILYISYAEELKLEEKLKQLEELKNEINNFKKQFDVPSAVINVFEKSNEDIDDLIFKHYLNQNKNCLDFIATCDAEGNISTYEVNKNIEERLRKFNVRKSSREQIERYKELAKHYSNFIVYIENELEKIEQGALYKTAFDVAIGGIFYYSFGKGKGYLFGATVEQAAMDSGLAYHEMELIFEEIKNKYSL